MLHWIVCVKHENMILKEGSIDSRIFYHHKASTNIKKDPQTNMNNGKEVYMELIGLKDQEFN